MDYEDENPQENSREGDYGGPGILGNAKEIEEIPLCANCTVSTEDDDRDILVQRAIRRINRTDGKLSQLRWRRGEVVSNGNNSGKFHSLMSRTRRVTAESPDSHTHHSPKLATDGVADDSEEGGYCIVPLDSTIYVNIYDPIGLPSFKPSPTKPIPQWMQPPWMRTLPNQHQPSRVVNPRPRSILDIHFSDIHSSPAEKSLSTEPETVCPTAVQTPIRVMSPQNYRVTEQNGEHIKDKSKSNNIWGLEHSSIVIPHIPSRSFATSQPLKQPSSRVLKQNVAMTTSLPPYQNIQRSSAVSPYPIPPRSTSARPHDQSRLASSLNTLRGSQECLALHGQYLQRRSHSPLLDVISHMKAKVKPTPPSQNKEHLHLDKCAKFISKKDIKPTASIAVAGRGRVRRIGNWEQQPVVETSRRDSRSRPSTNAKIEKLDNARGSFQSETDGSREAVITARGDLKRSSAHTDLWSFFGKDGGDGRK